MLSAKPTAKNAGDSYLSHRNHKKEAANDLLRQSRVASFPAIAEIRRFGCFTAEAINVPNHRADRLIFFHQ